MMDLGKPPAAGESAARLPRHVVDPVGQAPMPFQAAEEG
jgi:hypothetical protein